MRLWTRVFLFIALFATLPSLVMSQPAPIIRTNTVEAGGFIGASYGIDKTRAMGGGNAVYSLTRELMPFAEISYFPGIGRTATVSGIAGCRSTFSIPITDFNVGLHLRVPIPKSRIIPYGVLGFGVIHSPARTENVACPDPFDSSKTVMLPLPVTSSTDFTTSFGGGLRFYVTERVGFRGEFKGYKPTGTFTDVFYRVTGGFFYQF